MLVYKEDDIDFKNTNIIQKGTMFQKNEIKILSTKELINRIVTGNIIITAFINQNKQHELSIGAYNFKNANTNMGLNGGLIGAVVSSAINSDKTWQMVTHFKSLFDPITAQHIAGEITESGTDLINDSIANIKIPSQGSDIFYCDGNAYLTYYDSNIKSLVALLLK